MSEQAAKSDLQPATSIIQDGAESTNISTNASVGAPLETPILDKGKGISIEPTANDVSMDEGESSSEDEAAEGGVDVIEEEDNLEEIDPENIITGGRRTRGRTIDFAKAAKDLSPEEDEDDEDDDDFEVVEDDEMKD